MNKESMNKDKMEKQEKLEPLNFVIQQCPKCKKLDVYKDDGHFCNLKYQIRREEDLGYYD